MSRENIEIVRSAYEEWNAGDMDVISERYDPEACIVRSLEGWPEAGPIVGREALMAYFVQLRDTWHADTMELIGEPVDVGCRVVTRQVWRGEGQGPAASVEFTAVYALRENRIFLIEYFWDQAKALESLGVSDGTPTSRGNGEIIRHAFDAFNRGDLEGAVADHTVDFEYTNSGMIADAGNMSRGRDEYLEFLTQLFGEFDDATAEVTELRESGDQVLVSVTVRGRGKQSGATTDWSYCVLFTLCDGKVTHGQGFVHLEEALEAAGLSG